MLKPFQLRIPEDLKAFIAEQAAKNVSSQNSEIVRCIRERKIALTTNETPNPEGNHDHDKGH
ncbi:Arc family DNA-binding protein [Salibaculum sp.]|uniref:Arc family DNA-binding protein n=1 Tax=Salibaculum sp. TaxID=2855480 RepID=UPI002B4A2ED4|nr:Arc family DNA-binding protein [Salibaculum sp.]HKL70859.1 Arc family DNA-binding protein [Salibaculum sp.]